MKSSGQPVGVVEPEGLGAGDGAPGRDPTAISSKMAMAWRSVVPKRSSSTATTRVTVSACETSSGIGRLHPLDHGGGQLGQEGLLDPELLPVAHGAAHDLAQHVAAALVAGDDAVGDQEGHGAQVVGDHPQRDVGPGVLAVGASGASGDRLEQGREQVVS